MIINFLIDVYVNILNIKFNDIFKVIMLKNMILNMLN